MLALAPSRGFNYQGVLSGNVATTFTIYVDPSSFGAIPLVLLGSSGTSVSATSGTKAAAINTSGSASTGFTVSSYTLYDNLGNVVASGALPSGAMLVPGTLAMGQTFSPYAGMTATVIAIGTVPGASACATPANGATVQYTFGGQAWSVSYVPGCGITHFLGNNGESFTLTSIGSYPSLGTLGDIRTIQSLTVFDNVRSMLKIMVQGQGFHFWRPGAATH